MSLLNSQYDRIMREYDLVREGHRHELENRTAEVYGKIPEIRALDEEVATLSVRKAKEKIADPDADMTSLTEAFERIRREKTALLQKNGYPENYLEMQYDCPLCRDTGYIGADRCICFEKAAIRLLYERCNMGSELKDDSFARFSFDCYSDTILNENTKMTARETARDAYARAQAFVADIGQKDNSLFLYGNTGVGKTFLSRCIAREALERSFSTLYFSAQDFFELLANAQFGRHPEDVSYEQMVLSCDLLIIDDLGTEITNSLVLSLLFRTVNERLLKNRSTIISTNLMLSDFSTRYSERIFSRISSSYQMIKLIGEDIRLQKKTHGGNA